MTADEVMYSNVDEYDRFNHELCGPLGPFGVRTTISIRSGQNRCEPLPMAADRLYWPWPSRARFPALQVSCRFAARDR
jgi:hypothetical protein